MKPVLVCLLALAPLLACAGELPIVLVNGSGRDITLETPKNAPTVEILPTEVKPIAFEHLAWLRFGQEAFKYNVYALRREASRKPKPLVLQAHTDGKLYLLAPGTTGIQTPLPVQPAGFPIVPTKRVDLI